ncbi:hypothetical protein HDU93_004001 [Gonapodya sp. JEL0774]|nr:hypothetical protein HDU93_004001 [Gonapodya sp. JEL0774]
MAVEHILASTAAARTDRPTGDRRTAPVVSSSTHLSPSDAIDRKESVSSVVPMPQGLVSNVLATPYKRVIPVDKRRMQMQNKEVSPTIETPLSTSKQREKPSSTTSTLVNGTAFHSKEENLILAQLHQEIEELKDRERQLQDRDVASRIEISRLRAEVGSLRKNGEQLQKLNEKQQRIHLATLRQRCVLASKVDRDVDENACRQREESAAIIHQLEREVKAARNGASMEAQLLSNLVNNVVAKEDDLVRSESAIRHVPQLQDTQKRKLASLTYGRVLTGGTFSLIENHLLYTDMKPGNAVFQSPAARVEDLRLLDYGSSFFHYGRDMIELPCPCGIVGWTAPEALGVGGHPGVCEAGDKSELFSLGVCLYQMISGRLPFPVDAATTLGQYAEEARKGPTWSDHVPPGHMDFDPAARPSILEVLNSPLLDVARY